MVLSRGCRAISFRVGGILPTESRWAQPDFADGIWAVVDVDVSRFDGRTEKVNITVPRRVLAQIDTYTKAHGATRSGFLVEAARQVMGGRA
jgi:hypothetical protein